MNDTHNLLNRQNYQRYCCNDENFTHTTLCNFSIFLLFCNLMQYDLILSQMLLNRAPSLLPRPPPPLLSSTTTDFYQQIFETWPENMYCATNKECMPPPPPQPGPISFIFMQFSGKIWPNNRLGPHYGGWQPQSGKFWIHHWFL